MSWCSIHIIIDTFLVYSLSWIYFLQYTCTTKKCWYDPMTTILRFWKQNACRWNTWEYENRRYFLNIPHQARSIQTCWAKISKSHPLQSKVPPWKWKFWLFCDYVILIVMVTKNMILIFFNYTHMKEKNDLQ